MNLIFGIVAVIVLVAVVGLIVQTSKDDGDVVAFTSPGDLAEAQAAARKNKSPLLDAPSLPEERHRLTPPAPPPPVMNRPSDFYPGNLGLDTTLTYQGTTSTIVGVISFDFKGEVWQDYIASAGDDRWWRFGVEPSRGMKLEAFWPTPSGVEPGPTQLNYNGDIYTVTESGPANYKSIGQTGQFESGRYWYYDYRSAAGAILSFERFDAGPWISSLGVGVNPNEVVVNNFHDDISW